MAKESTLFSSKRTKPPRGQQQQVKEESLSDHGSLCSSSTSVNPVALMLGAFSAMKEDQDECFCNNIIKHKSTTSSPSSSCVHDHSHTAGTEDNTDSSYSDSVLKPQPAAPGTPTTAASSFQSPASSSSFLDDNISDRKHNPWQWVPSSSSPSDEVEGGHDTAKRRAGRKKLAPHILQELELAPLMDSSQSSFSSEEGDSISSSLVVASVALEVTGDFVDALLKNNGNKPTDDDNDESSLESDHCPQIPKEIYLYSKNLLFVDDGEQKQKQNPHQRQSTSAFNTTLSDDEGDVPLRSRTHSEEYEVVSV